MDQNNRSRTSEQSRQSSDYAPADFFDPLIEAYKKDVDRTILRENLKLTVEERFLKFEKFMRYITELREAGRKARQKD